MTRTKAAIVSAIIAVGTAYAYQALFTAVPDWNAAFDRAWFSASGIMMLWIMLYFVEKPE